MFFIGIFGIQEKSNVIYTYQNNICPLCGAYSRYDVIKSYNYFHAFFIPLFKWNNRYYVQFHCCNKFCNLDYDIGCRIERGERPEIRSEHVSYSEFYSYYKLCPNCSSQVDPHFQYCPYCGNKI